MSQRQRWKTLWIGKSKTCEMQLVEMESPVAQQPVPEKSLCSQNRALCSLTHWERHLENDVHPEADNYNTIW